MQKLLSYLFKFVLHYYTEDDTVEVLETLERNSGRDPFPKLLSRSKLPAPGPAGTGVEAGSGAGAPGLRGDGRFVHFNDLHIGGSVDVYGRALRLHDCDESTCAFYLEKCGRAPEEMQPQPLDPPPAPRPEDPPYNGFGSEADSLRNCHSLIPKARRRCRLNTSARPPAC